MQRRHDQPRCPESGRRAVRSSAIAAHEVPLGATAPVDDATWALAERIAAPAYTGDSTDAFDAALARAGIAVVADTSTDPATASPEVPLTGPASPVELLDFQAHALAVQAWGGAGWTGAELDSVVPLPSDAPSGTPSLGQLLAGYAASAATPGGAFARALLAGQDLKDPATVRFPAVVLFLFASDLATDGGRVPAPSASPSAAARLLPLAAGGPVVAAPAIDLTLICSGPSGWIDAVVQNLEAALINAMPPGIVGTILGAALSWFIHIAAGLVKGLVDTFLGPGPDAHPGHRRDRLRTGPADRLGHALCRPRHGQRGRRIGERGRPVRPRCRAAGWLVRRGGLGRRSAEMARRHPGLRPEGEAHAARLQHEERAPHFRPGPVSYDQTPLFFRGSGAVDDTVTDATGQAHWPFVVADDPGQGQGAAEHQSDTMSVAVHRRGPAGPRGPHRALLGGLPEILRPYVGILLKPILDAFQSKLNDLLDARGDATVYLDYHLPSPSPSPSTAPSASGSCPTQWPVGTDQGSLTIKSTTIIPPGQIDLGEHGGENDAGQAPLTVTVGSDGSASGQFTFTTQNHFEAQGISQGTEDTTLVETGSVGGTVCALTLRFLHETNTACQSTGAHAALDWCRSAPQSPWAGSCQPSPWAHRP